MPTTLHRRQLLHSSLALGLCHLAPTARACEFYSVNLRIAHPWTRASDPGATSALVCMGFDQVLRADRLIGVRTPVAGAAELGGPGVGSALDLAIPAGGETLLTEAGVHVRLLDLKFALEVGRAYPLELEFAQGGSVGALLTVDYARFA